MMLSPRFTGVLVRETVPDRVIDEASEIEVVDLTPSELLQRLRDGKVYVPDMAARAIEQFFNEGNLYALRELTLRRAAERIDEQMLAYMQTLGDSGALGGGRTDPRLRRGQARYPSDRCTDRPSGRPTARAPGGPLIYVETPAHHRRSTRSQRSSWTRAPATCRETGGHSPSPSSGLTFASTVIDYARQHNITRIIIGKTLRPRWQEYVFGSVVDQLIHDSGNIDVYVISSSEHIPQKIGDLDLPAPGNPSHGIISHASRSCRRRYHHRLAGQVVHIPDKSRHALPARGCGHRVQERAPASNFYCRLSASSPLTSSSSRLT